MAGMQALPRVFLALSEAGNAGAQCDTTQSKALFSRLSGQLQAGSLPDTSLVVKALLVARAVGWPSPALLRSLVARLASTASTLCRRLQAAGQADAATRLDDEGRLASALCMLCHTLQAAAVVTLGYAVTALSACWLRSHVRLGVQVHTPAPRKDKQEAFLEPAALLSHLPALETLYDAVTQQQDCVMSSLGSRQASEKVRCPCQNQSILCARSVQSVHARC